MDDAVHERLRHQKWDVLVPRLAAFAAMVCKQYGSGVTRPHAFSGRDPIDFAHDAITLVVSGKRAWDPAVYPDLLTHLQWVVRSIVDNAIKSKDNKLDMAALDPSEPLNELQARSISGPDAQCDPVPSAVFDEDFVIGFYEFLSGEPDLQRIVECVYYGHDGRGDIADCADITPDDMTTARKRLQTRLRAYIRSRQ